MTNNSEQHVDEMLTMGGEFFGQFNDPTEIKATRENYEKIVALHPAAYRFKTNEAGKLVAWSVVIPTSRVIAVDFVERRITERELLERTRMHEKHDALYLFAALTLPEYRGRGYAKKMLKEQIHEIGGDTEGELMLFAWTVTEAGEKMVGAIERELGVTIIRRRKAEK